MTLRNYAARQAPAMLQWLQIHHLAPDPFDGPRTIRMGAPGKYKGYSAHLIGTQMPARQLVAPALRPHDETSDRYARMIDDAGRACEMPQPLGYFEVTSLRACPKFGVHSSRAGNFIDTYCLDAALRNPKYELPRLALPFMPLVGRISAGILLAPAWYHNFYHWMVDILPRLQVVKSSLAEGIPVVVPATLKPVQQATLRQGLKAMGFAGAEILMLGGGGAYLFDRAILPARLSKQLYPFQLQRDFLRSLAPPRARGTRRKKRRIYISRRDAAIRRIANETEVEELLAARGFESVTLAERSFEEQIDLFRDAAAIVGSHGAGMTNLAFCDSGTVVIEIFQNGYFAPCFARLAQLGDLTYGFNVGEVEGDDIHLDTAHLTRTLDAAGL